MSQCHEFFCITCHMNADLGCSNSVRPMSMAHTLEEFNADKNVNWQAYSNALLKAMLTEHEGHDYRIATDGSYYLHPVGELHELMEDDYRAPKMIDPVAEWKDDPVGLALIS